MFNIFQEIHTYLGFLYIIGNPWHNGLCVKSIDLSESIHIEDFLTYCRFLYILRISLDTEDFPRYWGFPLHNAVYDLKSIDLGP